MNRVKDICEELGIIYNSEIQEVADEIIAKCISISETAGSCTGSLIDEYFNE